MKKRPFLSTVAVLGVLAWICAVSYAQSPEPGPVDIVDKLKLTGEQRENLKEIRYNFKKTQIGLRADLKTARLELRYLMMQETTNQREIAKLVDRVAGAQKSLLKADIDKKLAMKEILTQEQFEKFMRMRGERRKGTMERGGRFHPRHTGGFRAYGDGPGR